jgi:hypothetical protein
VLPTPWLRNSSGYHLPLAPRREVRELEIVARIVAAFEMLVGSEGV